MYVFSQNQRKFRQAYGKLYLFLFQIKIKMIGQYADDVSMVLLNHQSYLDVIFLEATHQGDLCWAAKKELGDFFIYGHALKAPKMILLDREDKASIVTLIKLAKKRLAEKKILAIFPEGTRSKGEESFLPFKLGAKMLIEKYKIRYQPIVVVHTKRAFNIDKLLIGNTEATFIALEPRAYNDDSPNDWYEQLQKEMHECYLQYYQPSSKD